jgi:hypothetical protein
MREVGGSTPGLDSSVHFIIELPVEGGISGLGYARCIFTIFTLLGDNTKLALTPMLLTNTTLKYWPLIREWSLSGT